MFSALKSGLSNLRLDRGALGFMGVLVVVLLADFVTRVWVSVPETSKVYSAPAAFKLRSVDSIEIASGKLVAWLPVSLEEQQKLEREIFFRGSLMQDREVRAIISLRTPGKSEEEWSVVRTGDTIDNWTIGEVRMRELQLVKGDQRRSVILLQSQ